MEGTRIGKLMTCILSSELPRGTIVGEKVQKKGSEMVIQEVQNV